MLSGHVLFDFIANKKKKRKKYSINPSSMRNSNLLKKKKKNKLSKKLRNDRFQEKKGNIDILLDFFFLVLITKRLCQVSG